MSLTRNTRPNLSKGSEPLLLQTDAFETCHFDSVHYEIAPDQGHGFQDMRQFGSGLSIVTSDCVLHQPRRDELPARDTALSITVQLSGYLSARELSGGKTRWLREGDVLITRRQLGPWIVDTPGRVRIKTLLISLPPYIEEALSTEGVSDGFELRRNALDVRARYLAQSLLNVDKSNPYARLKAEVLALDIVQHLLGEFRYEAGSHSGRSGRRLAKILDQACDILREERANPPTIVQLARRVGLNEFNLKSEFRKRFDCTIAGYVRSLRMNEAKTMLELGDCSVQEAALRVGYANPSHFTTAFRAVHGYNPSELIQMSRKSS